MKNGNRARMLTFSLAAAMGLGASEALPVAAGMAVDCATNPDGIAQVTVDTLHVGHRALLGDGITYPDGRQEWRHKIEVEVTALGEFAIVADGFGPIIEYNDVVQGDDFSLHNLETGAVVSYSAPPVPDAANYAPIGVTFSCRPNGQ